MRKTVFYGAISLDGFLADDNYSLDWLFKYNDNKIMKESYEPFFKTVDTTVMGRKTFDDLLTITNEFPYKDTKNFVLSHRPIESKYIQQVNQPIEEFISELKKQPGKDIWIVGGGKIVSTLIENNLIDSLQIQITPDILGSGIKLFDHINNQPNFTTDYVKQFDDLIDIKYSLKASV
ncbi:dihydrofolate reductase family protein [Companilactobacillus allii]|uniref:Bacterial bifunctional deaminase-reductase C-terminal domain-containing protein n=1 Tax=Companilactobacillus allii TaxID=1847728 RepID=A0A1P8Q619_9LACO|nr:dihydrofolate reductase family protein [Companilactobacillus allii]APX73291.1 hypothetical protein BTM29_12365 [Companilactobacillus allii]USQ68104.1 dihydrofolate reductase family protein [Companilactobacillus allii]